MAAGVTKTRRSIKTAGHLNTSAVARSPSMPVRSGLIALLLFGSGFCALLYETTWLREFRLAPVKMLNAALPRLDANDLLYQLDASREYNPLPKLETIKAPLLAINSADDEVNPPELGQVARGIEKVPHGRYILIPTSDETRGHGTHSQAAVWKQYLIELLRLTER